MSLDIAPRSVARARRMRWNANLVVGAVLFFIVLVLAIIVAPMLSGAANTITTDANLGASADHWLGTDSLGRDWLARTIVATRLTLMMTAAAALISLVLGVAVGGGLWLMPRWVREPGLRVLELLTAYPSLLLALIVATILGPGVMPIIIAIGLSNTLSIARLSANLAASISQQEYVVQARLFGVSRPLLLIRHVLPNMAEPILLVSSTMFALTLMEISGLSFLGIGVQLPQYDLGRVLGDALPDIYTRPIAVLGPALMISTIALAAMMIGDGLAAIADPRASALVASAKLTAKKRAKSQATESAVVTVRDLTVTSSGGTELVEGVSLDVAQGEIVGLVGESGSGKSLTALAIAHLIPDGLQVQGDEITVSGLDMLTSQPPRILAETVALVYQDPGTTFTPVARIGSQLADPLVRHKGMSGGEAGSAVVDALDRVRITNPVRVARRRPYELSGGMLQRAMIASAISLQPRLIVADEPTTALDVTVQKEILRQLRHIADEQQTAVLFISHDIAVVEALCDRVYVMKDGRIIEELTVQQLRDGEAVEEYTRELLAAVPSVQQGEVEPEVLNGSSESDGTALGKPGPDGEGERS